MTDIAIRVEKLSKKYRIGQRESYKALRDTLTDAMYAPFRRLWRHQPLATSHQPNHIWALKDISFEIKHGEAVGIIGRNGSGKSTLLKVLSRITEPTEGVAEIHGRVGSLLEVGTGFHPELTGRENIYLNGAILGMRKAEIERKFDEIVAFAEVEKFIDTPVKRYSSGMYVRLAFAVAAHLETEILLVDEILAVGDAAFQKKCLGKMGDVANKGRTILFVSHQMNSIRRLCEQCIWLEAGNMRMLHSTGAVVSAYEASFASVSLDTVRAKNSNLPAHFLSWKIVEPKAEQSNWLTTVLVPVTFKFTIQVNKPIRDGVHGIALRNSEGQLIWAWAKYGLNLDPGLNEFVYKLPTMPLKPGVYTWIVSLYEGNDLIDLWNCVPELVVATEPMTHPKDEWSGVLNIPCEFTFRIGK